MAKKKKKWIAGAVKKKGSFTAWCSAQGFGNKVTSECIAAGKKSKNPTTRRRANLAATLRKLPRHKKKRGR